MNKETRNKWILAAVLLLLGLIVAVLVAGARFRDSAPENSIFRDYYNEVGWEAAPSAAQRVMMAISDGMLVPGVCLAGLGVLVWISSTGFFDMIAYGFSSLLVMFTPFRNPKDHPRFYDYKQARAEKRQNPRMVILYVGIVFLALAAVFAGLYYVV